MKNLTNDILTDPIDFALQETMKRFENASSDGDKLVYGLLKRSEAMWNSICINGLQSCHMSYEQFCEQIKSKRNIIFLSDDEIEKLNKALQIMDIL